MTKRIIAVVVAVVLALFAGGMSYLYAATADARAQASQQPVTVVVTTAAVPAGTPAAEMAELVTTKVIPVAAAAPGAITSVGQLVELGVAVTTTDLLAGEQVLTARFVGEEQVGAVPVPKGLQQVSLALATERVVGGQVSAGSTVGVLISLTSPNTTTMALTDVLVVRADPIDADGRVSGGTSAAGGSEQVATAQLLITVAVNAADAEKLIFGKEHGTVWLTLQQEDTSHAGRRVVTNKEVKP